MSGSQQKQSQQDGEEQEPVLTNPKGLLDALPEPSAPELVHIDLLGQSVYMKGLSAEEQESYERSLIRFEEQPDGSLKSVRDQANMRAKYLVRALCDANGKRLYNDEDVGELARKRSDVINEMHDKALKLAGVHPDQREESRKNSGTTRTNASSSD